VSRRSAYALGVAFVLVGAMSLVSLVVPLGRFDRIGVGLLGVLLGVATLLTARGMPSK
jgi:hypothetical protein